MILATSSLMKRYGGRVVVDGGVYHGSAGHGRYVKRGLSQYLI